MKLMRFENICISFDLIVLATNSFLNLLDLQFFTIFINRIFLQFSEFHTHYEYYLNKHWGKNEYENFN